MEENKNPLMGHVVKVPAQVSGIPDGVQMTVNAAVTTFAAVDGKPAGIESMGTAECSWLNENIQLVLNDGVISISKSAVWTRKVQDVKNMVLSWKQKDTARAEKLREQARQAELKQQAAMVKAIVRELLKEQEKSRYPAGSPLDIGCDSNRPPTGGSALRTATTSTTPCTSTPMATGTTTTAPTRTASAPL